MSAESYFVLAVAGTAVFMDFLMERVINSFICLGLLLGGEYICWVIQW